MAKINGGIIGPNNPTGPFSAGGVWRLEDAFNAQKAGTWPVVLGYQIPNSLRFNSGSSDYLNRTPASATNQKTFTISAWVKLSSLTDGAIFNAYISGTQVTTFFFYGNQLWFYHYDGSFLISVRSTQLFRDVSAWYHVMASLDTTQATSTNRVKLYVNGSQITDLSASTYGSQNQNTFINSTVSHTIGRESPTQSYIGGYVSEFNFIDGQQLTPSSFGETDSTTGIWIPKAYTGTYGTNGFYLKFANSASLGTDSSGNGNNFTVNNLTSIDQTTDTPTNNFATLNALENSYAGLTLSEGNLKGVTTNAYYSFVRSTIGLSKGKWYMEVKCTAQSASENKWQFGISDAPPTSSTSYLGSFELSYGWRGEANTIFFNNTSNTYGSGAMSTGMIVGIALDLDNSKIYFSRDGVFKNSADPAAGTNGFGFTVTSGFYHFAFGELDGDQAYTYECNFGNPPFTISSGNADANGFGNFEYAVPSGYYALCSKNLALYG